MTKTLRKRHSKSSYNKSRRNKSRSIKRSNIKKKSSRRFKRGGSLGQYEEEDIELFIKYINSLDEMNPRNLEKKNWLLENIRRMPYEINYIPSQYMSNPSDPYYQGLDRIGAYLKYGDIW